MDLFSNFKVKSELILSSFNYITLLLLPTGISQCNLSSNLPSYILPDVE
jgi:hypothetical protein